MYCTTGARRPTNYVVRSAAKLLAGKAPTTCLVARLASRNSRTKIDELSIELCEDTIEDIAELEALVAEAPDARSGESTPS